MPVFPSELIPELGELGFLGANLEGYGLRGHEQRRVRLVMQELGARRFRHPQFRFRAGRAGHVPHSHLRLRGAEAPLAAAPPKRIRHRLFRADRGRISGRTPPACAPPRSAMAPAGCSTGEKTWITNGGVADVSVVWARTADGFGRFLVERGAPGFSTSDIHGKWSCGLVTSSLSDGDCRVDDSARLPEARGLKARWRASRRRAMASAGASSARHGLLRNRAPVCILRKQFDNRPIASHQLVQEKLPWMITEITKAQLLALHAGRLRTRASWSQPMSRC